MNVRNAADPIPLVILGGADRRGARLPEQAQGSRPLVGFKGIDLRIDGEPLVARLVDSLRAYGGFDPILIAGPEAVYRGAGVTTPVIDTDGGFGENLRAAIDWVRQQLPGKPLAFITCDVLPSREDLERVMADYRASAPRALWGPLIRAPRDSERLGAFGWKPQYRIKPAEDREPLGILPGHFAIIEPNALRLRFAYHMFGLAYRTRNRSIAVRRASMLRHLLFGLVAADLRKLCAFKKPTITFSVVRAGLRAARRLHAGTITRDELERSFGEMFVRTDAHARYSGRAIGFPLLEGLSFARDIDTVEEAEATGLRPADTRHHA